ncbi:uncharacterized protein BDZ99DRAFT_576970 [Mytilinidion resinicola]|uniref:Uncharacterized protein n=1 Tax=Mytilinidion resinicola TaxID=574789 RepID=A0A6A6Y0U9_9PEZI|nr:uncharacterized protein BDZ99DRAFT_576970 [Mytilinidion resinicola]KAF2802270.1 hypothetical protein BDZ99DRAFT_576970 [Mytilinidion resinicola]
MNFIGFTPETAVQIFNNYYTRPDPDQNCYNFLDHGTGHTLTLYHHQYDDWDPARPMTLIGLTTEFQSALLDPDFAAILRTETLVHWIDNTLHARWATFIDLTMRLKAHAARLLTAQRNASVDTTDEHQCEYAEKTAEMWRAWAARRDRYAESWLIQVQVPQEVVDGVPQVELEHGEEWKEYVRACRKCMRPRIGSEVEGYEKLELIKGHVYTNDVVVISRAEIEEIGEENVLRVEEEEIVATQWCFLRELEDRECRLEKAMRGKVWIDVKGPEWLFGESP